MLINNKRLNDPSVCTEGANALVKDRTLWHPPFSGNDKISHRLDFAAPTFVKMDSTGRLPAKCFFSGVKNVRSAHI